MKTYPSRSRLKFVIMTACAATVLAGFHHTPAAARKSVTQAHNEGFRTCRAQGRTGYQATVRGMQISNTPQRGGAWPFVIRDCFATRAQCERFTANIRNTVSDLGEIRQASCKAR